MRCEPHSQLVHARSRRSCLQCDIRNVPCFMHRLYGCVLRIRLVVYLETSWKAPTRALNAQSHAEQHARRLMFKYVLGRILLFGERICQCKVAMQSADAVQHAPASGTRAHSCKQVNSIVLDAGVGFPSDGNGIFARSTNCNPRVLMAQGIELKDLLHDYSCRGARSCAIRCAGSATKFPTPPNYYPCCAPCNMTACNGRRPDV